jgi:hypothetical protein
MSEPQTRQLTRLHPKGENWSLLDRTFRDFDSPLFSILTGAAVLLAIQLVMAFPYFWTGNEENYFALARQWIAPETTKPFDAVFDTSRGKSVGLMVFGFATHLLGDNNGRLIIGFLAFAVVSFGFAKVARVLGLSLIDTVVVFAIFLFCGQSFFGGEWFIGGVETKTFSYGFGLIALAATLEQQTLRPAIWCAVATYFHFLVGGFWIGCNALLILFIWKSPRRAGEFVALLALLISPIITEIAGDIFRASSVVPPPGLPPADYIYSILRASHHVAPFANSGWARPVGAALLASAFIAAMLMSWGRKSDPPLKSFAFTVACLALCIPAAFVLSWFDRETGFFGKFYLFRPVSPILLLSLFALSAFWRTHTDNNREPRIIPSILIIAVLAVSVLKGNFRASATRISDSILILAKAMRENTGSDDPILTDPSIDEEPSLPRISERSTIVNWKFVPTNPAQIYRWWILIQFRQRVFAGYCPATGSAIRYVVATRATEYFVAKCGQTVWRNQYHTLIKLK